jgi:hypothetical protein
MQRARRLGRRAAALARRPVSFDGRHVPVRPCQLHERPPAAMGLLARRLQHLRPASQLQQRGVLDRAGRLRRAFSRHVRLPLPLASHHGVHHVGGRQGRHHRHGIRRVPAGRVPVLAGTAPALQRDVHSAQHRRPFIAGLFPLLAGTHPLHAGGRCGRTIDRLLGACVSARNVAFVHANRVNLAGRHHVGSGRQDGLLDHGQAKHVPDAVHGRNRLLRRVGHHHQRRQHIYHLDHQRAYLGAHQLDHFSAFDSAFEGAHYRHDHH